MAKKMGRPKLAGSEYRGEFIIVRLRPGEKRMILKAARESSGRPAEWIRNALLAAARRTSGG